MPITWKAEVTVDGRGVYVAGQIRDDWIAVGFFLPIDGALHLADLTVAPGLLPGESADDPSEPTVPGWLTRREYAEESWTVRHIVTTRPPHAVFARVLRMIPVDEMQQVALAAVREAVQASDALRGADRPVLPTSHLRPLVVELSSAERRYLEAAVALTRLPEGVDRPAKTLAEQMGLEPKQVSNLLTQARVRGWLTSPGVGRTGGKLTELGATLVKRHFAKKGESK